MRFNSIGARVIGFHETIRESHPHLCRIAIALYDVETDLLQTFASSNEGEKPFDHYQAALSEVPSLLALKISGESRIIDDLGESAGSMSLHTRRLLETGIRSSFTVPMFSRDEFIGFIFFDANLPGYFSEPIQAHTSLYAQLIGALIANDLSSIRALKGAVMTAREFNRFRDEETSDHLSRMAHYCRIVAREMADDFDLDDEFIEFFFQFAALHDIGKVAIPDRVLLQPHGLAGEDLEIMRSHVQSGVQIIDTIIREFGFSGLDQVQILRNLVATHHERWDGSGYPAGLRGTAIPIEGRITMVCDVFDALTSARPYKEAWSFDEAINYLVAHSASQFDPACVAAVQNRLDEFRDIHTRFGEGRY